MVTKPLVVDTFLFFFQMKLGWTQGVILERYDAGHIFLFTLGLWTVLNVRGVCRPVIVGLMGLFCSINGPMSNGWTI